jgi:hypothetical protein
MKHGRRHQWRCRCDKCPAKDCCLRWLCTLCARVAVKQPTSRVPDGPWLDPDFKLRWYLP